MSSIFTHLSTSKTLDDQIEQNDKNPHPVRFVVDLLERTDSRRFYVVCRRFLDSFGGESTPLALLSNDLEG
jgi:hypothetical protein